jgi:hypothetical protein
MTNPITEAKAAQTAWIDGSMPLDESASRMYAALGHLIEHTKKLEGRLSYTEEHRLRRSQGAERVRAEKAEIERDRYKFDAENLVESVEKAEARIAQALESLEENEDRDEVTICILRGES